MHRALDQEFQFDTKNLAEHRHVLSNNNMVSQDILDHSSKLLPRRGNLEHSIGHFWPKDGSSICAHELCKY